MIRTPPAQGNPLLHYRLVVLPDAEGLYPSMAALAPRKWSVDDTKRIAKEVILAANKEDEDNEGGCDDGLDVQESVIRRLVELGFLFDDAVCTVPWDSEVGALV